MPTADKLAAGVAVSSRWRINYQREACTGADAHRWNLYEVAGGNLDKVAQADRITIKGTCELVRDCAASAWVSIEGVASIDLDGDIAHMTIESHSLGE